MTVRECDVPSSSTLNRALIERSYFHDSYRAPLTQSSMGIIDIFFALFGHHPLWMKLILIARNVAARIFGLEAPMIAEILKPRARSSYVAGDKIGPWPVCFIGDHEIVAGRNNKHLDFRLSVLKVVDGETTGVVVSTVCSVHNLFGKIYLFFIIPFHRAGVQLLMSNAVTAKRI